MSTQSAVSVWTYLGLKRVRALRRRDGRVKVSFVRETVTKPFLPDPEHPVRKRVE